MYIVSDDNFRINNEDLEVNTERQNIFIPVDTVDHVFHKAGRKEIGKPEPDLIELYTKEHALIYTLKVHGDNRALRIHHEIVKEVRIHRNKLKGENHE